MAIANEKRPIYLRLDPKIAVELRAATVDSKNPYAPTLTQVMERGAVLALEELKRKSKK